MESRAHGLVEEMSNKANDCTGKVHRGHSEMVTVTTKRDSTWAEKVSRHINGLRDGVGRMLRRLSQGIKREM